MIFDVITSIRNIRAEKNVAPSKKIDIILEAKNDSDLAFLKDNDHYLQKFTNYEHITYTTEEVNMEKCVLKVVDGLNIYVPLSTLVNLEEEKNKLLAEEKKMEAEIARCNGMLNNPNFLSRAPEAKINEEKAKLKNYEERLASIKKLLADL